MRAFALTLLLVSIVSASVYGQKKFICQPCGLPCDETVSTKSGLCPTCQMAMVELSTVTHKNLSPRDFCARIDANPEVLIVDVRTATEFDGSSTSIETFGHFKKAINININQLTKRLGELSAYRNKEVLVYCNQNYRSPRAAYYLSMQGFTNVKNLEGGLYKAGDALKSACFKNHFVAHKK